MFLRAGRTPFLRKPRQAPNQVSQVPFRRLRLVSLCGFESKPQAERLPFLGPLFEGFVATEILKEQQGAGREWKLRVLAFGSGGALTVGSRQLRRCGGRQAGPGGSWLARLAMLHCLLTSGRKGSQSLLPLIDSGSGPPPEKA